MDKHKNAEPVSMIITVYNRGDLLPQTIDSALRQTYPNTEVIVVDDGSTDDTPNICARYGDKIRYFRKENGGQSSALNRGISEMRGAWFKWLDSDDILEDNAVEELLQFANEKQAKIVYSDYTVLDSNGKEIGQFITPTYATYSDFAASLWNNSLNSIVNPNSVLIHKNVFEEVGLFDTSMGYGLDIDFFLRACIIHGMMFYKCSSLLLRYRVHKRQQSAIVGIDSVKYIMQMRKGIMQKYVALHGEEAWVKLMRELRDQSQYPVWKPLTAKFLTVLPTAAGNFIFRLYKYLMGRRHILYRYEG